MHIGLLVFIILYWVVKIVYNDNNNVQVKRATVDIVYREQLNPAVPFPLVPEKRLEYIVNSKKIPCAFERYYYIKLNMPLPIIKLEPDIIERHYQKRLKEDTIDIGTLNDVEAAQKFFNDRIGYLSHQN